ncbi:uncharacterized protein BCR38DRAFT_488157 [Pseudomassariella vexata]|uniref:Uncharacterized protein n=1 Tax=Pseudomassariella vexata TaxID=1141098 RepID=A0A1Y2DL64_9PEZI|nr:uncharacterized protein BCR38DRAFT_488157 [Pseudomassariella vexata]ORY59972.1 hypothetical protein BCR38DRAFT_488157 [Pseudomassariella vexata]
MLNTKNNTFWKITTRSTTLNLHGCVFDDAFYAVTDGSFNTAQLANMGPVPLEMTVLLHNFYQQPFIGFKDSEIDPQRLGRDPLDPAHNPTAYFVNGTTMVPRSIHITTRNANSVASTIAGDGNGLRVDIQDTGALQQNLVKFKDPCGKHVLYAQDRYPGGGGVLMSRCMLSNPISSFYDGSARTH